MCFWWFLGGLLLGRGGGSQAYDPKTQELVYYHPMLNCYVRDNPVQSYGPPRIAKVEDNQEKSFLMEID